VFATRAYGFGCARIEIRRVGDQFKAEETFLTKKMQNHYGGIVVVDGTLYGTNNPVIANGHLYICDQDLLLCYHLK